MDNAYTNRRYKVRHMKKVSGYAILVAAALSWFTISCSSLSPTGGASGSAPSGAAATVAVADPPGRSAGVFLLGSGAAFFALVGGSVYFCRYKPQ